MENSTELKIAFTEKQIADRVTELGAQISRDYDGEALHLIGILEDGFIFLADLVRSLTCPVSFDFVKMQLTDVANGGSSVRHIEIGPFADIKGKDVLIVDMLADSGVTLDHLFQRMLQENPKSLRTAVLIDRENRRHLPFSVDYAGFRWSGAHLVGYGLELKGMYRNLPYVAETGSLQDTEDAE